MTFDLFWIDIFFEERLFGFGVFSLKRDNVPYNLLAIYWNDGELFIDLFWLRLPTIGQMNE